MGSSPCGVLPKHQNVSARTLLRLNRCLCLSCLHTAQNIRTLKGTALKLLVDAALHADSLRAVPKQK